ncbi:hypothetical protein V7195_25110 [Priestia megaterium]|uniref:hypothetical protein n=1 Tax=Priestia megaterium TaxID=1404 RepID=UPI000BF51A7E|nr:hypothetical protein [Priestia megaterium]PFK02124.1 hypothetical protein COI96_06955 [Priestia megaterium]PMD08009.1 hypothetical protein CJ194_18580 [Priestia megaterium]TJZ40363.1 hypothetical protein FA002_01990 [Priestia megaterium]
MFINKSYNHLSELCYKYQQDKLYGEEIPESILLKSQKRFNLLTEEKFIAYLDTTILGSGKNGIYFTDHGIKYRSLGGKPGSLSWEDFANVNDISIYNNVEVNFDHEKVFLLGGGSNYPDTLFIELLVSIRDYLREHSIESLLKEHSLPSYTTTNEIKNVCTLFENYDKAFEINNGLVVAEHISEKTNEKLIEHFNLRPDNHIIAFLSTFSLKKMDGIIISGEGIYFKETFVSLYYPWYVFQNLPLHLSLDELIIGKNNVFHLTHCNMDNSEVLLFLRNLQQCVHLMHKDFVTSSNKS